MKKKQIILSGGIIILSFLLFYSYYSVRKRYYKNFLEMDSMRIDFQYQEQFVDHFFHFFQCPLGIYNIVNSDNNNLEHINKQLKDPLSRSGEGLISYIPIYNPDNKRREGFVILSAGTDGRIDNIIRPNDTLFTVDFEDKLRIYNSEKFYRVGDTIRIQSTKYFNVIDYFFGNRDYLVEYINCLDLYKQQATKEYELDKLIENLTTRRVWNKIVAFNYINSGDIIIENDSTLIITDLGYIIKCCFYDTNIRSLSSKDSLSILGTFEGFDINKHEIILSKCIQLD